MPARVPSERWCADGCGDKIKPAGGLDGYQEMMWENVNPSDEHSPFYYHEWCCDKDGAPDDGRP